jgi:hypothetical protein
MIKSFVNRERVFLRVMEVIDRYIVNGTPECDLVDASGVIYSGCTIISLGGSDTDRMSTPALNAEVLTITQGGGAPFILGALAEGQEYREEIELTDAGEYPPDLIGIDHSEIQSAGARIIAGDESLYLSPKTRIQGALEISDGATPLQHIAIAEPTIDTLETYQARLDELRTAVISLQTALAQVVEAASADVVTGTATKLSLVSLPTDNIATISAPNDTIASEIATIER